jgi:hypothetical protein
VLLLVSLSCVSDLVLIWKLSEKPLVEDDNPSMRVSRSLVIPLSLLNNGTEGRVRAVILTSHQEQTGKKRHFFYLFIFLLYLGLGFFFFFLLRCCLPHHVPIQIGRLALFLRTICAGGPKLFDFFFFSGVLRACVIRFFFFFFFNSNVNRGEKKK